MPAVFDPADQKPSAVPGGMHGRPNAAVFMTRATKVRVDAARPTEPLAQSAQANWVTSILPVWRAAAGASDSRI